MRSSPRPLSALVGLHARCCRVAAASPRRAQSQCHLGRVRTPRTKQRPGPQSQLPKRTQNASTPAAQEVQNRPRPRRSATATRILAWTRPPGPLGAPLSPRFHRSRTEASESGACAIGAPPLEPEIRGSRLLPPYLHPTWCRHAAHGNPSARAPTSSRPPRCVRDAWFAPRGITPLSVRFPCGFPAVSEPGG